MNEQGKDALVEAALKGVRQIKGHLTDNAGGYCAMGVLSATAGGMAVAVERYGIGQTKDGPRACSVCDYVAFSEISLITHLNDVHAFDFLTIARKLEGQ